MRVIARTVLLMFIMTILLSFVTCVGVLANPPIPPAPGGGGGGTGTDPTSVITTNASIGDAQTGINKLGGTALRYLQLVGSIVAVVILAIYGVQWFLASPQQKAILKEKAFAYIIGAALVFGGATIMGWIGDTFANAVR